MARKRDIEREERHEAAKHAPEPDIVQDRSHDSEVEHDIVVQFVRVITVPISIGDRQATVYVGVTGLGRLAGRGASAEALRAAVAQLVFMKSDEEV